MLKDLIKKIPLINKIDFFKKTERMIYSSDYRKVSSYRSLRLNKYIPTILLKAIDDDITVDQINSEIAYNYFNPRENLLLSKIMNYNSRYVIGSMFYEYTIKQSIERNKADMPIFLKNAYKNYINNDYSLSLLENNSYHETSKIQASLVGPAKSHDIISKQVDNNTHVIRLNYTYKNKGIDGNSGYKTTISYLSYEQSNNVIENNIKLDNKVKYISKKHGYLDALTLKDYNSHYGSLNLGTLAILDFLNRYNATISIYRLDMFLTSDRYKNYHPQSFDRLRTNGEMDKKKVKIDFRKNSIYHQPYMQYIILKSLFEQGYLIPDKNLSIILNNSVTSYLKRLESIY